MPNYEKHIIVGHVGNDPEIRYTSDGVAVCSVSVAVNNPYRKDDPPTWYKCSVWRATAEFVNQYVTKGAAVLIEGDGLKLDEWTAQDGTQRVSIAMQARSVQLLGRNGTGQDAPQEQGELPF